MAPWQYIFIGVGAAVILLNLVLLVMMWHALITKSYRKYIKPKDEQPAVRQ